MLKPPDWKPPIIRSFPVPVSTLMAPVTLAASSVATSFPSPVCRLKLPPTFSLAPMKISRSAPRLAFTFPVIVESISASEFGENEMP